jgi:hypothetical protein
MTKIVSVKTTDFNPNPFMKEGEELGGFSLYYLPERNDNDVHRGLRPSTNEGRRKTTP